MVQIYNQGQHHAPHNHGLGGISFVVFVDFDQGTFTYKFIAPFTSMKDGNVFEMNLRCSGRINDTIPVCTYTLYIKMMKTDTLLEISGYETYTPTRIMH